MSEINYWLILAAKPLKCGHTDAPENVNELGACRCCLLDAKHSGKESAENKRQKEIEYLREWRQTPNGKAALQRQIDKRKLKKAARNGEAKNIGAGSLAYDLANANAGAGGEVVENKRADDTAH